jgi:hypothetical protein
MRAAVAIAHKILVSIWHMLTDGTFYQDLGLDSWTSSTANEQRSTSCAAWPPWDLTFNSRKRPPERA